MALCKTCNHPERHRIELELAAGVSLQKVGDEFGLTKDSVARHWNSHVPSARKAELIGGPVAIRNLAKRAAEEDRSLIDYYTILRSELFHLFQDARQRGLTFDCASIADRLLRTLDGIGKLTGQLRAAGITINNVNSVSGPTLILNDPQVVRLQSVIIRSLSQFPEARAAVVAALRDLDVQDMPSAINGRHGPPLAVCGPPVIEAELADA
jgi:hypothetical protein